MSSFVDATLNVLETDRLNEQQDNSAMNDLWKVLSLLLILVLTLIFGLMPSYW